MYEVMVEDSFDAAHQLVGYDGPCENLHGHGWKVQVFISGNKLNELGMLIDFKEVKASLKQILSKLDHGNLNDLPDFKKSNPTSENVSGYIFNELIKIMDKKLSLNKVTVFESPTSSATYTGDAK